MKIPKISINVAKKGPAEKAGSRPIFFNNIGTQEPKKTDSTTTKPKDKLTIKLPNKLPETINALKKTTRANKAAIAQPINISLRTKRPMLALVMSPEDMP